MIGQEEDNGATARSNRMVGGLTTRTICRFTLAIIGSALIWSALLLRNVSADQRIIDQPPHDLLTLKKDAQTFKIVPLELKRRVPLRAQDRDEWLVIQLLKRPEQRYQVRWADIERVQLFEELVLAEAAELAAAGDFDTAYEHYRFVEKRAPEFPGLATARHQCMFREAEHWLGQGKYANALVLLNELYRLAPRFSGLKEASGRVVDRMVEEYLAAGQHVAGRELLDSLAAKYPSHDVVQRRRQQLVQLANNVYDTARAATDVGKLREAHALTRSALRIWPDLEKTQRLAAELGQKYPVVRVGVRAPYGGGLELTVPPRWTEQRCRTLVDGYLYLPDSYGAEGVKYRSRIVSGHSDAGRTTLSVRAGVHWPGGKLPVSSADVASQIVARGEPSMLASARVPLTAVVESIQMVDATALEIVWKAEPPLWQALLQIPIRRDDGRAPGVGDQTRLGAYQAKQDEDGAWRFMLGQHAYGINARQPREISETVFADTLSALRALRTQEIQLYDRVVPWDVSNVRAYDEVRLVPYAAPTVHMLIPNPRSQKLASRIVRRALSLALDRSRILRDDLGDGKVLAGAVLSGPFPQGYGSDAAIQNDQRDARQAAALLNGPFAALGDRTITLVHPPDPVARRAVRAIQTQWNLNGIGVELVSVESPGGDLRRGPGRPWDLWYLEWNGMEPWSDAVWLLGRESIAGQSDPQLQAMVDDLQLAATWDEACAKLRALHRYVARTQAIIPLWQINEFAAVRRDIEGVGDKPVTLYQNVDQWKVKLKP